jgi:hypothetical protein
LTLEAQKRIAESPLSKREIMRRLGTSAAQLYRLLDQTNYRKSVDQVLALLQVLNCEVDLGCSNQDYLPREMQCADDRPRAIRVDGTAAALLINSTV